MGLTLSRVTKLNGDEMVRPEGLLTVKTASCNELIISVPGNIFKFNNQDTGTTSITSFWCLHC